MGGSGVIDNFPVRAMRRQGRGMTIGVDIDTGGALAAGADVSEPWSAWQFFRRMLWKRNETLPIPSIVRILLRSALVASASRAAEDRAAAESIQSALTSGANTHFTFGHYEAAIGHFHRQLTEHVGMVGE